MVVGIFASNVVRARAVLTVERGMDAVTTARTNFAGNALSTSLWLLRNSMNPNPIPRLWPG